MSDQDFILEDEKDKEINMKTSMGGQDDQPEKGVDSGPREQSKTRLLPLRKTTGTVTMSMKRFVLSAIVRRA